MVNKFLPGNLQWLGIAPETTSGTPAAAPTIFIPATSPKWTPNVTMLTDDALRGQMGGPYNIQQGARYDQLSFSTYIYPDNLFPILKALLGGVDHVTGTTAPYTHAVSLYNGAAGDNAQPGTYTGFLYQADGKAIQSAGMVCSEVKIAIKADALPTLDVTWMGMPSTFVDAPTNTPSTSQPFPPWTAAISVGGVAMSKYSDVELDWKRDVKAITILNGSQNPMAIYGGAVSATGTLTAVYQGTADADLVGFLANTQPSLSVSINPAGDPVHKLTIQHSKVAYSKVDPAGSNNSWMTVQATITALMNATDALDGSASLAQAQLVSTIATAF